MIRYIYLTQVHQGGARITEPNPTEGHSDPVKASPDYVLKGSFLGIERALLPMSLFCDFC